MIMNGKTYLENSSWFGVGMEIKDTKRAVGNKGQERNFQNWVIL